MSNDFTLLLPEFIVCGLAFGALTLDFALSEPRKRWIGYLSAAGLALALAALLARQWSVEANLYEGLLSFDAYSLFFRASFIVMGIVAALSSVEYVRRNIDHPGEYYAIMLFAVVGMMLMASSREMLTAYISLELLSFSLYALVSFDRYNPKSNEGGAKYILLGALSSALLLYGISQLYGLLGATRFDEIAAALSAAGGIGSPGVLAGVALVFAGLGFKLAAVPFHMWAPDAYEGAPIPIAAFLAVASKAAAFALVMRFFADALMPAAAQWRLALAAAAALTMTVGNLIALAQTNLKRLLAYSSVAHVGYLLMGIAALGTTETDGGASGASLMATNGVMLHIAAYGATNFAAFLCLAALHNAIGGDDIADFAGAARRSPYMAMVMAAALFSLAGLPIFAGFVSKFYLFSAAAAQGLLWLAAIAIFTSLVSLYYYLQVVRQMYMEPAADESAIRLPRVTVALLGALLAGMVALGVYPAPLMGAIQRASEALLGG